MDALATVEELRYLTGAAWPDELAAQQALHAASGQVRTYCGWPISYEEEVGATLDSNGSRIIALPCLRLTAVHEVLVHGEVVTDYEWSASGVLYRAAGWPRGLRAVWVNYSGGYEQPPPELLAVVCGLTGRLSTPAGVASWSVGAQTVTFSQDGGPGLSSVERAVLDRYRIVPGD